MVVASLLVIALGASAFKWSGANLAGADFGEGNLPGTFGKDYTYPTHEEVDYYASKGFSILRLPFRWERLQQKVRGEFDSFNQGKITDLVQYATSKNVSILLDPHNYARYYGQIIGDSTITGADFADFWTRLANLFKSNNKVIFGLVNEPNTMKTEVWLDDANAAIAAIRSTGSNNTIFVPGNAWTGAASWFDSWYGTPNAQVMANVKDPANNWAFDIHSYLDSDGSGTHPECVSAVIGSTRLKPFTEWAREKKFQAFLGEFAGGPNDVCKAGITDMLTYMKTNSDVWAGFTWWAGGPWWGPDSWYGLDPKNGQDAPQVSWLVPFQI